MSEVIVITHANMFEGNTLTHERTVIIEHTSIALSPSIFSFLPLDRIILMGGLRVVG